MKEPNDLMLMLKNKEILGIGYLPKPTGMSEMGTTTVVKLPDDTVQIFNPDNDNHQEVITDQLRLSSIIWEFKTTTEPA